MGPLQQDMPRPTQVQQHDAVQRGKPPAGAAPDAMSLMALWPFVDIVSRMLNRTKRPLQQSLPRPAKVHQHNAVQRGSRQQVLLLLRLSCRRALMQGGKGNKGIPFWEAVCDSGRLNDAWPPDVKAQQLSTCNPVLQSEGQTHSWQSNTRGKVPV